ncbi:MAG: hypothetical protein ACRBCK_02740 [Alphaproteobacteria bacterium]
MRIIHFIFAAFLFCGFVYPAVAATDPVIDFLQEKIEGVALSMNLEDAKAELEKRGYAPVIDANSKEHVYRFRKDEQYELSLVTSRLYTDTRKGISDPIVGDIVEISYQEYIPKIVDINNPETHYICPKVIEKSKKFCPHAGSKSCEFEPNVRIYSDNFYVRHHPDDKYMFEANAQVNERCNIIMMRKIPSRPVQ